MDVRERFQHAANLVESGNYPEATTEFVWLWDHMLDEDKSFAGVRGSYLIAWMKRLMDLHEDACMQFTILRDKLVPRIAPGSTDYMPVMDWFTLSNNLLDDHSAISAWVDELLASESEPLEVRLMRSTILSWLFEQARWEDAGNLLEPGQVVAAQMRLDVERERHTEQFDDETLKILRENRLKSLAKTHLSYLAANRIDESQLIKELMIELFGVDQTQSMLQEMNKEIDE